MNERQKHLLCLLQYDRTRPGGFSDCNPAGWSPEQWRELTLEAGRHGLQGFLHHKLQDNHPLVKIPAESEKVLKSAWRANHFANFLRFQLLGRVLAGLKKTGVPVIVLKGAYLAQKVYPNIGRRLMIDVDLLIRPEDLEKSDAVMAACGFRRQEFSLETSSQTNEFHYLEENSKAAFEIHWELVRPDHPLAVPRDIFWEQAVNTEISGTECLSLAPEHLLLHLALHASKHGFNQGLRSLCDLAEVMTRLDLSWPRIRTMAAEHKLERALQTPVFLAHDLLGVPLPAVTAAWLRPAGLSREILADARRAVLLNSGDQNLQRNLVHFFGRRGRKQVKLLLSRVFPPRSRLATLYPVNASSARIFLCYPRYFWSLLKRNLPGLRFFMGRKKRGSSDLLTWLLTRE